MLENDFFACTNLPSLFHGYPSLVCDVYWIEFSHTIERVKRAVWGMLYADDAAVVSRSADGLARVR